MPVIAELQDQIRTLQAQYHHMPSPDALREKVLVAYIQKTLSKLEEACSQGIDALTEFLKDNWTRVKGTALSPTAIPDAGITKLLCDVAMYVASAHNKANPKEQLSAIQQLMPTVTVESIRPRLYDEASQDIGEGYQDLTDVNPQEVLKTHILGREGRFLLPVKILAELGLNSERRTLENPYVAIDASADFYYVTAEEYARLVQHSPLTQAVNEAHQQYHRLLNDKSNLLGQLTTLCFKLGVNSVTGLGSEDNAGAGTYAPIIIFSEYYDTLTAAQKNSLPKPLKKEIELLLSLASNPRANINATENLETCIATRRTKILAAVQGNEAILSCISISGESKESLLTASKECLFKTIGELIKALASKSYEGGHDTLSVNRRLLEWLEISFSIASKDDLNTFKTLSSDEMTGLLQMSTLPTQLIHQINSLENLVLFIMGLAPEKITAMLNGSKKAILNTIIKTTRDFSALLISLEPEKCRAVIEGIKSDIPKIIKTGLDFSQVLRYLTPAQRTAFIEGINSEYSKIIKTSHDFIEVVHELSPEQRTTVVDAMKSEYSKIIKTSHDFIELVQELSPEQRTTVVDAMKNEWPNIIKWINDFSDVLPHLTPLQCTTVIECIKMKLPKIIKTSMDFMSVMEKLTPLQHATVLNAMKSEFTKIIKNNLDFFWVLINLNPEQRTTVFNEMKSEIPNIIKNSGDFKYILLLLSPTQCAECRASITIAG